MSDETSAPPLPVKWMHLQLRDHFAGLAMASLAGARAPRDWREIEDLESAEARRAYRLADAMLKAREETP